MNKLEELIREEVAMRGPISVARYMELALQHPAYGYYRQGDPLGRKGDFITAPEVSQMFGELIGLWLADTWRLLGKPSPFVLLEMGPGRGTLMADALRATARVEGFAAAMKLCLLESNQTFRAMQAEKLATAQPLFLDDLGALPEGPLFFVANEFFDALPIHQFVQRAGGWAERMIDCTMERCAFTESAQGLGFFPAEADKDLSLRETSPIAVAIMRTLTERIKTQGGAGLVIDYGYVAPPGLSTLQAVAKHHSVDVLERPGEVDLTAHVDFGVLHQVAESAGLRVAGPDGQGAFLKALGIDLRADQLRLRADEAQKTAIEEALARLVDPSQMGTLFKVMGVCADPGVVLAGFA